MTSMYSVPVSLMTMAPSSIRLSFSSPYRGTAPVRRCPWGAAGLRARDLVGVRDDLAAHLRRVDEGVTLELGEVPAELGGCLAELTQGQVDRGFESGHVVAAVLVQ